MARLSSSALMVRDGGVLWSPSQAWSGLNRDLSPAGVAMMQEARVHVMLLPRPASLAPRPSCDVTSARISPHQAALPSLPGSPQGLIVKQL